MLPNFIGIGAAKSGTTWLFRCLQEHPEVFVAPCKETNFFDYDTIEGRLSEYEAHFQGADGFKAVGEISIRYLSSKRGAAERIKHYLPEVKLFVSLRNPVEQVYSHYWHLLKQNFHQWDPDRIPNSFEQALEMYPDKLIEPARYYTHLCRWLQYFGREQLHIILYDDICQEPEKVMSELYAYLGVEPGFRSSALRARGASTRRGVSPRHPGLEWGRRVLYDRLNRYVYHPMKQVLGVQTAIRIKERLKARELLEFVFMKPGYPPMRPETRATLRERFAEEIAGLAQLIGRDLSHWR